MSRHLIGPYWRIFLGLTALLLSASTAHAGDTSKKISLQWKGIEGAVQYEIRLESPGHPALSKVVEDPKWSGSVPFGFYTFQIRAIDQVKRPGDWSAPAPLVVMPPAPELQSPSSGRIVKAFDTKVATRFQWQEVPGATAYEFILRKGDTVVQKTRVAGHELDVTGLVPADYRWKVVGVIESGGRAPAAVANRKWSTEASDEFGFEVRQLKLEAPVQVFPIGKQIPPDEGDLHMRWNKVENADAYEVIVQIVNAGGRVRTPASEALLTKKYVVREPLLRIKVPGEGTYHWKVRGLANVDPQGNAGATGPQSSTDFQLDRNAAFFDGAGYVAFSAIMAPYVPTLSSGNMSQSMNIPTTSNPNQAIAYFTTARLSGEYWFHSQWAVGSGLDVGQTTLTTSGIASSSNGVYTRVGSELTLKYRQKISNDRYGWFFSPKASLEYRQYNYILPTALDLSNHATAVSGFIGHTLGPSVGFDLRKQFTEKFSIGGKFALYYPAGLIREGLPQSFAAVSGNPILAGTWNITGTSPFENWSAGVQGFYWFSRRWGGGIGGIYEARALHLNQTNAPDKIETITANGAFLFASLLYSFGQ